jgi:signal transduction histidine kinase
MKLLSKFHRVNVVATIIVLLISGVCYYFFIKHALIEQLDKDLAIEEREAKDFVTESNALPDAYAYKDEEEEFIQVPNDNVVRKFSSVQLFNKSANENVDYRQLEFPLTVAGKNYKVVVRKSQEETEDLIQLILTITLMMVLLLLISLFLINRFILSKLWKPFNNTLSQLKQFNVSGKNKLLLEKSDINEFTELNQAVSIMTNRVSQDFNEIKNFTENASHEIQTPLAIIKSKLELLSQSENLKEEQMNTIQSIFEAGNRLSKLNQSLILLTKIDNQQFVQNEKIDFSKIVLKHIENFEELIAAKHITTVVNIAPGVKLKINEDLAEILISNLITNAIRHNLDKGSIDINLSSQFFIISNTGAPPDRDPGELFERFRKDKVSSESLGLGLSIVKKICEQYQFSIDYVYSGNRHITTVGFNN